MDISPVWNLSFLLSSVLEYNFAFLLQSYDPLTFSTNLHHSTFVFRTTPRSADSHFPFTSRTVLEMAKSNVESKYGVRINKTVSPAKYPACVDSILQRNPGPKKSGLTDPDFCITHATTRSRVSSCDACRKCSQQIYSGARIPSILVSFDETIFTKSTTTQPPPPRDIGPCENISDAEDIDYSRSSLTSTYEASARILRCLSEDINRIRCGMTDMLVEYFTPSFPCLEGRSWGCLQRVVDFWELEADFESLDLWLHQGLKKRLAPVAINRRLSFWCPLKRGFRRLEQALSDLASSLETGMMPESPKVVEQLQSSVESLVIQGQALLSSWTAEYRWSSVGPVSRKVLQIRYKRNRGVPSCAEGRASAANSLQRLISTLAELKKEHKEQSEKEKRDKLESEMKVIQEGIEKITEDSMRLREEREKRKKEIVSLGGKDQLKCLLKGVEDAVRLTTLL